jgi:hypothetical protein
VELGFFWVEVAELNLSILLQGGIREIGAQMLFFALPQTKQYLFQDPLRSAQALLLLLPLNRAGVDLG